MKPLNLFPMALACLAALLASFPTTVAAMAATRGGPLPAPLPLFPADNWWNLDVSNWPVDPGSANYIGFINNGGTRRLHPDFGGNAPTTQNPDAIYGIPFAVVSGVAPSDLLPVEFIYSAESDGVDHVTDTSFPFYPIPPAAITEPYWIEGGSPGNVDQRSSQDRHLLIVDYERNHLYELYNVFYDASQSRWHAGSGAFFDMNTNDRRPDGWTSADAAGLAILPGLVRYDEVYDDANVPEIRHAFRVTVRATNGHVYPASHTAGSAPGALPMGARLRLKASVDVNLRTTNPNMRKIMRAMQRHGLIVADNGSDMYITGTYDTRWSNDILNPAFATLTASDFEVLQLGYNPPSGPAALSSVSASPSSVTSGQSATGTVSLNAPAPSGGATVTLSSSSTAVIVPTSTTVVAGATTASFAIATTSVAAATTATITGSYLGVTRTSPFTVNPVTLTGLSLSPAIVNGGSPSIGTVILNGPAPAGGLVVNLTSSRPTIAVVPTTTTVPAEATAQNFTINTANVTVNTTATIAASAGGLTRSATLTIRKRKR